MADWLPAVLVYFLIMMVRLVSGTPDDQCRFIFKEDVILNVSLSTERGAIVKYDFHAHDRFHCAETCCASPGDWCSLSLFNLNEEEPEKANCFLIQCVPDASTEDVCVRVHRRYSGMMAVEVAHPASHDISTTPSNTPSPGGRVSVTGGSSAGSSTNEGSLTSSLTSPSTPVVQHSDMNQHPTPAPQPSDPLPTEHKKASLHSSSAATEKADVTETEPTHGSEKSATFPSSQSTNGEEQEPTNNRTRPQENAENINTESSGEVNGSLDHREDVIYGKETVSQTGILIVTLCFGIIFFLAVTVVVSKRWMDGYRRRKYSKVDYLINGIYS